MSQKEVNQKFYEVVHHLININPNFSMIGQKLLHELEVILYDSSHTTITGDKE